MNSSPSRTFNFDSLPLDEDGYEKAVPLKGLPELNTAGDAVEEATHSVAPTLRPEEADEPLLRENPNRFVLFPIKYHEVRPSDASQNNA